LARRVGLECLWEDQMGSGGSIKRLVVAGTGLLIEFDFANNAVLKASVSFPESPEIVTKHSTTAAEILLRDLRLRPHESALTKMLDKFAVNLERLAALDKLSVLPQLNCHEAIAGIYESLKRLHEWEVSRLREEDEVKGKSQEHIIRTALRSKSGRPRMNARNNVGLSLDYWQERHVRAMGPENYTSKIEDVHEPKTWSLIVECAPSPSLVYPSVRVTDKWISSDIQKANPTDEDLIMETGGAVLDWQDPENIILPLVDAPKGDNAMEGIEQDLNASNPKYPDVMFVAKFYPPLVVPYSVASQIYSSTGANLDQYHVVTLDTLLFPPKLDEKPEPDATYRRLQREQILKIPEQHGQATQKTHKNTLTFQKLEYGRTLTELPFSHPRQLVNLLPLFRQYASLSSLLDQSFGSQTKEVKPEEKENSDSKTTIRDEYEAFLSEALSDGAKPPQFDKLPIDVSLHTQPHPALRLTFPFRNRTADICFDIGMNGAATVGYENVLDDGDGVGKRKALKREDLVRMLELSEDLGIFIEFVRRRLQ
jgi:Mediator of RNA polymerase II transcription subunit 1